MWNVNIPLWQLESNCYREVFVLCRCHSGGGNSGFSCDTVVSTYSTTFNSEAVLENWFHISVSKRDLLAYTYYCYNKPTCDGWFFTSYSVISSRCIPVVMFPLYAGNQPLISKPCLFLLFTFANSVLFQGDYQSPWVHFKHPFGTLGVIWDILSNPW